MILALLHWLSARLWLRRITAEDGTPYLDRYWIHGWMPEWIWSPIKWDRFGLFIRDENRTWWRRPRRASGSTWGLYLHHFRSPDHDIAPHSHPWQWAVSLVLAGGYTEQRLADGELVTRRVRPWTLNFLRHDTCHVVTELHGRETWTLFLVGPKSSSWGFWVEGRGFVPWRERLAERGLDV